MKQSVKYLLLALGLFLTNFQAQAQEPGDTTVISILPLAYSYVPRLIPELYFTDNVVQVSGFGNINSQALTGSFYKPWYQGGLITDEMKEDVKSRMGLVNLAGYDLDFKAQYTFTVDSFCKAAPARVYFSLSSHNHADVSFTDRFFRLAFEGNKAYEGSTVQLAPLVARQYRYQILKAGFVIDPGGKLKIGGGLGIVNGDQLSRVEIENASFYTAPLGTELSMEIIANRQRSDTSRTDFGSNNGLGMAGDFMLEWTDDSWGSIMLEVRDAGFISWNDQTLETVIDSTYLYAGINVPSVTDLSDSVFLDETVDSLADAYSTFSSRKGKYTTVLPGFVHLQYGHCFGPKTTMLAGVVARFQANYDPFFYLRGKYDFKKVSLWGQFGYGGYGKVGFGLGGQVAIGNSIALSVGSRHLEGLLFPSQSGGIAAEAQLTFKLGKKE